MGPCKKVCGDAGQNICNSGLHRNTVIADNITVNSIENKLIWEYIESVA